MNRDTEGFNEVKTIERSLRERFIGTLLGAAVGDALGGPVEFMTAQEIQSRYGTVREMMGGGSYNWRCGEYTDDTAMMLCVAESLVVNHNCCLGDIAQKFVAWYKTEPKDIGCTTREALSRLENGTPFFASGVQEKPTNGSIMRCAPLSLTYLFREDALIDVSVEVSAITHKHAEAKLSCVFLNLMISKLLLGVSRAGAYNYAVKRTEDIDRAFVNKYITSSYDPDPSKGLAVNTLLLATSSFMGSRSFEEAVVKAVNLGGDADTTGAVTGALAGAYFGRSGIPRRWSKRLNPRPAKYFVRLAEELFNI